MKPAAVLASVMVAGIGAKAEVAPAGPATAGPHAVYLRGPGDPDCAGELDRARARQDATRLFLTELKCRIHPKWKCPVNCKTDELLGRQIALNVKRDRQRAGMLVWHASE